MNGTSATRWWSRWCAIAIGAVALFGGAPAQAEMCCLDGTTCLTVPEELCLAIGGTYDPDAECDGSACPTGVCCYTIGCIEGTTPAFCASIDGVWQGYGITCADVQCTIGGTGACCFSLKGFPVDCDENYTQSDCELEGGSWLGAGSSCFDGLCDEVGACCITPTGECIMLTEVECYAKSGINQWYGGGVLCADVQCVAATGACCYADGSCVADVWEDDCWTSGGEYRGTGSECGDTNCCIYDVDGDNLVGFSDLVGVLSVFGECIDYCPADINQSGDVNIMDVLLVLAHWGTCIDVP